MKNNSSKHVKKHGKFWLIGILLGAASSAQAGDYAFGFGYSAGYSDNITRVPTHERSDWTHSLLAGGAYRENTTDLVAQVLAQAEYRTYQNNSFDDETIFNLNSSLLWVISPQRLTWSVVDTYRQSQTNPTQPYTPANRSNVNVFSTGPDFYLRFSPLHVLAFGARAANVYTGDANADNNRFTGTGSWQYQSSAISTYSLNYQVMDVKYGRSTLNDFTRHDAFVRAQFQPTLSRYVIDAGSTRISRESGKDLKGSLTRLSWLRQSTPESTLGASVSREFSDTGSDILAASEIANNPMAATGASGQATAGPAGAVQPTSPAGLAPDVVTSDVYYAKRGDIFYTRRGVKFGMRFQAYINNLDYETFNLDRRESGGRLELDYLFSTSTTVGVFTQYTKTKFLNLVQTDVDKDSGLTATYRMTRTISFGAEGHHTLRTSTLKSTEFTENRVLFSVMYSSGPLFTPTPGR